MNMGSEKKQKKARLFLEAIDDLLINDEVKKLYEYKQHLGTTRFSHSLGVSFISWKLANFFHLDAHSAARTAMLHDFCLYNFHTEKPRKKINIFYHPKVAAKMSSRHFNLNKKQLRAIRTHMFPLGPFPTSLEAWIITAADKYCAIKEFIKGAYTWYMSRSLVKVMAC
jgi:uncharacterized protein